MSSSLILVTHAQVLAPQNMQQSQNLPLQVSTIPCSVHTPSARKTWHQCQCQLSADWRCCAPHLEELQVINRLHSRVYNQLVYTPVIRWFFFTTEVRFIQHWNSLVTLCAAQCFPAVSSTQASLPSAIRKLLWYVHGMSGSSKQAPPCPCSSSKLVMMSMVALAVWPLSRPSLVHKQCSSVSSNYIA